MVKKSEDWFSYNEAMSSSVQIRKYLKLCQEWILQDEEEDEDVLFFSQSLPDQNATASTWIGMTEKDTNIQRIQCCLCGKSSNTLTKINANPFSLSNLILTCSECSTIRTGVH